MAFCECGKKWGIIQWIDGKAFVVCTDCGYKEELKEDEKPAEKPPEP